jgi:single-strand DNA-binding protein
MSGVNQITIVGNVGSAPELKYTQSNVPFCRFSVAVNEQWSKDGEKQERVTWFPVVAFNGKSEACANYLEKGRLVAIVGKVRTREYETKDGTKHQVMQIVADTVSFLGSSRKGDAPSAAPTPGQPQQTADDLEDVPF